MLFLILGQIAGFIGQIFYGSSSMWKSWKTVLTAEIIGALFFAVQWFLLGSVVAAMMNIVWIYVSYLGIKDRAKADEPLFLLAFPVTIVIGVLAYGGNPWEILAVVATIMGMATKALKHFEAFRFVNIIVALMWVVVGAAMFALPSMLTNMAVMYGHAKALILHFKEILSGSAAIGRSAAE